jgi:hypothetical protein
MIGDLSDGKPPQLVSPEKYLMGRNVADDFMENWGSEILDAAEDMSSHAGGSNFTIPSCRRETTTTSMRGSEISSVYGDTEEVKKQL